MTHDTEVLTHAGWKSWEEIKPDEVFACRGQGGVEWHSATAFTSLPVSRASLICIKTPKVSIRLRASHLLLHIQALGLPAFATAQQRMELETRLVSFPDPQAQDRFPGAYVVNSDQWTWESDYTGRLHSAVVPGGCLFVRGHHTSQGFWIGDQAVVDSP